VSSPGSWGVRSAASFSIVGLCVSPCPKGGDVGADVANVAPAEKGALVTEDAGEPVAAEDPGEVVAEGTGEFVAETGELVTDDTGGWMYTSSQVLGLFQQGLAAQ